jgi:hypothetical protein
VGLVTHAVNRNTARLQRTDQFDVVSTFLGHLGVVVVDEQGGVGEVFVRQPESLIDEALAQHLEPAAVAHVMRVGGVTVGDDLVHDIPCPYRTVAVRVTLIEVCGNARDVRPHPRLQERLVGRAVRQRITNERSITKPLAPF